ncbi:sulfatase-like hydrolase/transferase [Vallitalea okinawensis]|uniref:sulfatase-like hydrolase/transferase n=1 Tax=Vallitalea okinawensis TaxID=2078660 RepID=UPI000CFB93EF|nr:sulfatase-like hydrolase/transferase [Vallitalea okinawensis]
MIRKEKNNPNIVFILSDDHGVWAMGCYGNKEVKTPNLDRLAREGMLFTNYFCTSPVCSAARASLLTGRIPSQHGIHDWLGKGCINKEAYKNKRVSKKRYIASLGDNTDIDFNTVPEEETVDISETAQYRFIKHESDETIQYLKDQLGYTDILNSNGYQCGISGKWHLGDSPNPQKGFSYWSVIGKGGCIYHLPDFHRYGQLTIEDRYITDIITEEGIQYIEKCNDADQPFYLSLHYTAPHSPWIKEDQPKDIWDSYNECPFESVEDEPIHPWQVYRRHPGIENKDKRRYMLQGYYTAVTAMDKSVGDILNKLDELGIRDNTIVVFTSDNGMNLGQHGIWGKGNGTFPQNMYDTSVKVPMIISRPQHIPQGLKCDELLSHYDFMPTILDYVGLHNPEAEKLPGMSFANLLRGVSMEERENVVVYDEYGPVRMIRTKEFKYVHRYPHGPHELYDVIHDPHEKINLINNEAQRDTVVRLRGMLESWFVQYVNPNIDGARLPVTGDGQIDLPGTLSNGKTSFNGIYKSYYDK